MILPLRFLLSRLPTADGSFSPYNTALSNIDDLGYMEKYSGFDLEVFVGIQDICYNGINMLYCLFSR